MSMMPSEIGSGAVRLTKATVRDITEKALKRIRRSWTELDEVNGFGRYWHRPENPRYARMKEINDIGVRAYEEIKVLKAQALQDWEAFDIIHFQGRIKFHIDALTEARDEVIRERGIVPKSRRGMDSVADDAD